MTSSRQPVTIADMKATPVREQFLEMIARPDADIDLVAGALLIAKEEYPALDVTAYHSRLDRLAEQTRPRLKGLDGNPFAVIDALNTCLFAEEGFRGDTEQYFDPRNSFLNDVLDRKRGIPITLSVISIEVAARLGYSMRGVGFPGHFIVTHATEGREILIDPFHQGEILMLDDCRGLLKAVFGSELPFDMRYLAPVSKRQILTRMLGNLKAIYMKADDYPRALRVIDRLVALAPEDTGLLRDRGYSNLNLCHFERAVNDLEAYLSSWPAAADARAVRKQITSIRRFSASLN